MALVPDLQAASLYALAAFLVLLGFLVVFVESMRPSRAGVLVASALAVAALLAWLGEAGLGLIVLGIGAAIVASRIFDWLTSR